MPSGDSSDGSGTGNRSDIITVCHLTGTPVLTGDAADITGRTCNIARIIAPAYRAGSVQITGNTADGTAAIYISSVSAVADFSGGKVSDDSGNIR